MKRSVFALLAAFALLVTLLPATTIAAPALTTGLKNVPAAPDNVYIVRLADDPAVSYGGGIAGYAATRPAAGRKIDPTAVNVKRYVARAQGRHNALLKSVGASTAKKIYSYAYAINGFAAVLTRAQATKLANTRGVISVTPDRLHKKTTDNSGAFMGLDDATGGLRAAAGLRGENVIVGIIDTGIWPEHPSFSDQSDLKFRYGSAAIPKRVYGPPPASWHGVCQTGERWNRLDCNNKLIGARYFFAGFGKHGIIAADFRSARDKDGHGTHTSSTAAGNAGVPASIFGISRGTISGIAPRARVAMYKALWNDLGGFTTDLAAAIDAAVADGVDVINYSIGSDTPSFDSADAIAFLFANDAGVFASVSAGNAGPDDTTVGAPAAAPWVATIGASTQNRAFTGSVRLGSGTTLAGDTITRSLGDTPLVDAANAGSELCFAGQLNPSQVSGRIVLCKRGVTGRVEKGAAVKAAGGAGMILYNQADAMVLMTDNHVVPAIHVNNTNGLAIKAYIVAQGNLASASITTGTASPAQGSKMAEFSSRGPNGAAEDILKPDLTAPGVQILAGNSPVPFAGAPGQLFQAIAGTSMSAPHVAGLAALLTGAHPNWTPDQIKSALMLTARQDVTKENGSTAADPFDMGAGHVRPNSALNPGVTMNATLGQYIRFLCATTPGLVSPATCTAVGGPIDPSDLNMASISIAALAGSQTVSRRFTSVDPGTTTWTWSVQGLNGIDVSISPSPSLALTGGASATWQATFTVDEAPPDAWVFGAITWRAGDGRMARLPVALRPARLGFPSDVTSTSATNTKTVDWTVQVGYNGTLSANGFGMAPDDRIVGETVAQDPDQDITTDTFTVGVKTYDFTLLPNTRYLAGGTFQSTTTPGSDLDVYLFYDATNNGFTLDDFVAQSADGDSEEIVELHDPAAGAYRLVIHGWGTPGGAGSTFDRHLWTVTQATADSGTLVATAGGGDPLTVSLGQTVTIHGAASGLTTTGLQYRGVVTYDGDGDTIGTTTLLINRTP